MNSYGFERDRLAHALTSLLAADEPTLGRTEARRVLQYRDLVLTNLTSISDQVLAGAPSVKPTLGAAAAAPARALRTMLQAVPAAGDPIAPSEVFATAPRTSYARTWRTAAQASLLAADALATGQPTSWRTDPDTAWSVMADTSAAIHAIAVLDRRLATHPSKHLDARAREALHATWRTGLRLVASEVSRLAHTHPLANDADHVARPPALRPFPITDSTQLATGYQHTLRLLQARDGMLPIRTLGHFTVAQARISHTLADHCQRAHAAGIPTADELTAAWRAHALTAESLSEHRRAVTGLLRGTHHPVLAQASEVLRAVERLPARHRHDLTAAVAVASTLLPQAAGVERTLAHGIAASFARDLYLVANENFTRRRHSLPWVSARHATEEHPLLAAARDIQETSTRRPSERLVESCTTAPTRRHLQQASRTHELPRSGPPAMNLG